MLNCKNTLIVHSSVNSWVKYGFESEGFCILNLKELLGNIELCYKYSYIIFFDSSINAELCEAMLEIPSIKIIVFYWNRLDSNVLEYKRMGVTVITCFDESAKIANIPCVNTLAICSMKYYQEKLDYKCDNIEYDYVFCGAEKDRGSIVCEYSDILSKIGIYGRTHIVSYAERTEADEWAYDYYLSEVMKSKSIMEVQYGGQVGPSQRLIEAAFLNKKLITDYAPVVKSDLYMHENVFVLGEDDVRLLPDFLNSPIRRLDEEVKKKYTIYDWLYCIEKNIK